MEVSQREREVLAALPTTAFHVLDRGQVVLDHGATTTPSYLASARKSVLFLSARGLGRLGVMMLQRGRWNGRQEVPA